MTTRAPAVLKTCSVRYILAARTSLIYKVRERERCFAILAWNRFLGTYSWFWRCYLLNMAEVVFGSRKQLFSRETEQLPKMRRSRWFWLQSVTLKKIWTVRMEEVDGTGLGEKGKKGQHAGLEWEGIIQRYKEGLSSTPGGSHHLTEHDWGKPLLTQLPWEDVLFASIIPHLEVSALDILSTNLICSLFSLTARWLARTLLYLQSF